MGWFLRFAAILAVFAPHKVGSTFNVDDSTLYAVKFNSFKTDDTSTSKVDQNDEALLQAPSLLQTVTMTTSHNEKYVCELPSEDPKDRPQNEVYEGPSVMQLLTRLFVQSQCAYRLEHYWTYELCHGKYLRQYHEERDGKNIKTTEYYLGHYSKEKHDERQKDINEEELANGKTKKPMKKKIEAINMPFFELVMTDGTTCDLNGLPRTTRVHYVCYPTGKHEIYSLKEASTCEYEVVVLSSLLCSHPDYRPEESNELVINCKPANEETSTKPQNLLEMEAESMKLRSEKMYQAEMFQGDKGPGSVRIEIKPVTLEGNEIEEEDNENKDANWPQHPPRQPFKPLVDPQVVQEFLLGQHCLYGGTGWWKYEFCYGRKVDQYHQEKGGQKTVINLGMFDLAKHLEWIKANPNKRPKPVESRKHVSHFYSGGDLCDVTGKPRHVEVKLKCKPSESPSAVSIYLLEPRTCEYVLGVESPLVCDILSSADENGLMKMTSMSDFTTTTTTTTSTLNQVKFTLEDAITDVNRKVVDEIDLEQDQAIYDSLELAKDYLDYDEEDEDDEE